MQNTKTDTLETVGIPSHGKRIDEMDFLKAVFIILMITFHLTFIGNTYPYAKQLVYTFHVPAFLVISIVLIALDPVNLDRHTIAGAVMVYLVMSLCLFCFRYLRGRVRALSLFIGRNTLVLLVFSPVFTVLTKLFQPYLLRVDGSGILFMVVAVIFTVAGCFGTVYVMDWLHLSRYFFGQEKEVR
jgi:fucose 4-O-acetylase-like acetyltransferase